jgi:uncharacterized protein (DUF1697 family)
MTSCAALLKGVNVGGNRKLPMAQLTAVLEGLGFADVRTLLASGNAVFTADAEAAALEQEIERALADAGLPTHVLVRTRAELDALIAANPFPEASRDRPSQLLVMFLRAPLAPDMLDRVTALNDGPETFALVDRALVIDHHGAMGQSKLPAAMARAKFPAAATGRNWNTLRKLADALA